MENNNNQYQKIVPFILFIIALIILFLLVRPMISILLGSVIIAYISFPLYKRIMKRIPRKSLSIILSLLIVFILILIPFAFLAVEISKQGFSFYDSLSKNIYSQKGALFGFSCNGTESKVCLILNQAEKFNSEQLSKFGLDNKLEELLILFKEKITTFILSIPLIIAKIFLTFVIAYFILKDWENLFKKTIDLIPMRIKTKEKLIQQFGDIAHTVIYAQLFVALVQGIVGTIGFYLLGVPFPIILGLIMAFCALIPAIGTAIIWVPASLYLILIGIFSPDYWVLSKGIILLLYGFLVISTIDNFLLAKIVNKKAQVSPIIVIVGVIGGFSLFGVAGIFAGPILLPLLITYFKTFKERFN